jgi:cytochrome c oxidase subunit IV
LKNKVLGIYSTEPFAHKHIIKNRMAHAEHLSAEEAKKANVRTILRVTAILSGITALEFALALGWPESMNDMRWILNMVFLTLTVFKAFYIIADFMHLRHEAILLILSIMLPTMFVVWLIVALLIEGDAIYTVRYPQ